MRSSGKNRATVTYPTTTFVKKLSVRNASQQRNTLQLEQDKFKSEFTMYLITDSVITNIPQQLDLSKLKQHLPSPVK